MNGLLIVCYYQISLACSQASCLKQMLTYECSKQWQAGLGQYAVYTFLLFLSFRNTIINIVLLHLLNIIVSSKLFVHEVKIIF